MTRNLFSVLRSAIAGSRRARRAIRGGRPADALAEFSAARHNCGLATGLIYGVGPLPAPASAGRVWSALGRVEAEIGAEITRLHRAANQPPADRGQMVADVAAGIDVLRTRDGAAITPTQVLERARNIVAGLTGNYDVRENVATPARMWPPQVGHIAGVETRGCAPLVTGGA